LDFGRKAIHLLTRPFCVVFDDDVAMWCELSLDPEVAILFGREIGQSNGDILLTIWL